VIRTPQQGRNTRSVDRRALNIEITDPPQPRPAVAATDPSRPFPGLRDAIYGHLFSVPLMSYVWTDLLLLNAALRERILTHARTTASPQLTNLGGWRSTTGQLDFLGDLQQPLLDRMVARRLIGSPPSGGYRRSRPIGHSRRGPISPTAVTCTRRTRTRARRGQVSIASMREIRRTTG
jgi:hypothetical protein